MHVVNPNLDKFCISAASLCALHCLLVPLALPLAPLVGLQFFAHSVVETAVLITTFSIGLVALSLGFAKRHRQVYPFYLLLVGTVLYALRHEFGATSEPLVILAGAVFIVLAHLANIRLCQACPHCKE